MCSANGFCIQIWDNEYIYGHNRNAPNHDACFADSCRNSLGLVLLLRPVNAAMRIVGNETDAPTSNTRNTITVATRIFLDNKWIINVICIVWRGNIYIVSKPTCGSKVRNRCFGVSFTSFSPPFSMAVGDVFCALFEIVSYTQENK